MSDYYHINIGGILYTWSGTQSLPSRSYKCYHCNSITGSSTGFEMTTGSHSRLYSAIYLCGNCGKPTFMDWMEEQIPYPIYGEDIEELSKDVKTIFQEARLSFSAGAYTGVAHLCRTILAHVAVDKGAGHNKPFLDYVNYLNNEHYLPRDTVDSVDLLRKLGNNATHDLEIIDKDEAELIIDITSLLLKNVYEFPNKSQKKNKSNNEPRIFKGSFDSGLPGTSG